MGSADAYDAYLQKHAIRGQLILENPDPQLHTIIAIPATNESGLTTCLDSLFKCDPPVLPTEVAVLINSARNSSEEIVATNRRGYEEVREWIRRNQMSQNRTQNRAEKEQTEKERPDEKLRFHVVLVEDLPDKHFGAGLARKLVMDEAVRRLAWAAKRRSRRDEQTNRDVEDGDGQPGRHVGEAGEVDKVTIGGVDEVTTGGVDDGVTGGTENGSTSRLGSGTDAGQSREQVDIQKSAVGDGIIISLDADTVVRRGYLRKVEKYFDGSPEMEGCSISFEHPLNQQEYNHLFCNPNNLSATPSKESRSDQQLSAENFPPTVFDAVTNYELHQRYYLQAVRYTGYPYACHTVGSCFAVRAETYCRMGGMSRRKAGEDFYFIQKIAMHGRYGECRTTRVHPSPRPSDRVPFGTGPDISRQLDGGGGLDASVKHPSDKDRDGTEPDSRQSDSRGSDASLPTDNYSDGTGPDSRQLPPYLTFNPELFEHLRKFFTLTPRLYRSGSISAAANIVPENDPAAKPDGDPPVGKEKAAVLKGVPPVLGRYLEESRFWEELEEIRKNTASEKAFRKRFFNKFNMFRILKYLHFAEEHGAEKIEVTAAAGVMLEMWDNSENAKGFSTRELLLLYRKYFG